MIQQMSGDDYQVIKLAVMAEVKSYFRPEFINRLDEVLVFHALDERHIASIARTQLQYLEKRLAQMEMRLEVSRRCPGRTGQGRLRPGLRHPAAETDDPAGTGESAGEGDSVQ